MMKILQLVLLFVCLWMGCECATTCLDQNGKPVDMFILYKLPRIYWYKTPPYVQDGHGYLYLDSNNMNFRLSDIPINSTNSAAGLTLDQVYSRYSTRREYKKQGVAYTDGPQDLAHVFYNDENPDGGWYETCGHTKGALAFDSESGFWLITSVPKYPNKASEGYHYPHSGCKFGQMFICVSFNSTSANDIGYQMRLNDPHIHDANLPDQWDDLYPNVKMAIEGHMIHKSPIKSQLSLPSLAGQKYLHFAKARYYGKDLYHDFVAPSLQSNLHTETWQYGTVIGPSCNGSYQVTDVVNLNIELEPQSFSFECRNDHSKFAVTTDESNPYICIGDINREPSQFKRGGGTLCIKNHQLWNEYSSMITNTTHCPSRHYHHNVVQL